MQIYNLKMKNSSEQTQKNTHGGKREGAGRPVTVGSRNRIGLRVPDDIVEILERQPNRTAFILEAIRSYARQQP